MARIRPWWHAEVSDPESVAVDSASQSRDQHLGGFGRAPYRGMGSPDGYKESTERQYALRAMALRASILS